MVARCANPSITPFSLRLLDEDESWKLFQTKLMIGKDANLPEDLEGLGQKIVHKCDGLPLAIVVLGGLLSTKPTTHNAWSKVLDSVNWELNQNERNCRQILALSYIGLPDHLKPCFLYLGLFPEDFWISSFRMIRIWVAEGFIQPRGRLTMEDVAEDYLEELIQRSLIQKPDRLPDDRVSYFQIHDLVRDLAISKAKQERFLEVLGGDDHNLISTNKSRRLSFIESTGGMYGSPDTTTAPNQGTTLNHLHSLFCFSNAIERNMWMKSSYGAMKLLRVLELNGVKSIPNSLLKQIGKLILLKYLSFYGTNMGKLPSSIGDLQNLQTLDLCYTLLSQLPKPIMKLQQLRNLFFHQTQSFHYPLDHMTELQVLMANEGKWIGKSLEKLTTLRTLCIESLGKLSPYEEVFYNALPKLKHLQVLALSDNTLINHAAGVRPPSFSDNLEICRMFLMGVTGILDFPPNLISLSLHSEYSAQAIDELMVNLKKLPKLRSLVLNNICGSNVIFSADGFSRLEELAVWDLGKFTVEEGALPNLRDLRIAGGGLKRIPCGLKQVVTLQKLTLSFISKELEYRVQKDMGEDWEIIKHIPSIEIGPYDATYGLGRFVKLEVERWC